MLHTKNNIVLIGMPGSGKSTVGVILAKMTKKDFLDTDVLIQTSENRTLQDIVDTEGAMVLRQVEERVLLTIDCSFFIIATGGSAAYSDAAMCHLKKNGIVVFLHADLQTLKNRIKNFETRGLAKSPGQTITDLFNERFSLYAKYADITVESGGFSQDGVCSQIMQQLSKIQQ